MADTISIRPITATETFSVRHPILRAGQPLESCNFDGDWLDTTRHFGLFIDTDLIGVVSMYEKRHPDINVLKQFQVRGMAVLEKFQKRGFGAALVNHAESEAINMGGELIWFNARDTAVAFYSKLGYEVYGEPFVAIGIIHFVMHKRLQ